MTVWWLSDPQRLSAERVAIQAIDEDWFENAAWSLDGQLRLRLVFDIVLPRGRYRLAMVYHNTFPASPPSVRPVDGEERLSLHQYGRGGDLCLSIRNDNWTPDVTGSEMARSAYSLLEIETPNEDGRVTPAPSAHDVAYEFTLRNVFGRFYLERSSCLLLATLDLDGAPIEVAVDYRNRNCSVAHLLAIGSDDGQQVTLEVPQMLRDAGFVYSGSFHVVGTLRDAVRSAKTVDDLRAIVGEGFSFSPKDTWACLIRTSDNEFVLLTHGSGRDDVYVYETIRGPSESRRSGQNYAGLAEKRVGIVGLGSLGSKIAVSLARAGVGRFELVDGDILHVGNLERHDADWRDVGRHKVQLTASRLQLIDPHVEAHPWTTPIGAQVSSQEAGSVNAALAACDLLIDATANPDVFNHLASMAMRSNHALVWGAVYAGGIGGEIARSRPDKDPSPYAIRQVITQFYETTEEAPPLPAGRGYDGSMAEDAPLIATDADVSVFAAHMAAYAMDALIGEEPSVYEVPAYLIGLKRAWLFDGPFDARPLAVDAPLRTPLSVPDPNEVDSDFLKTLFDKFADENQGRETDS